MERVADGFVTGFGCALNEVDAPAVLAAIDVELEPFWQPYALEGAGMALTMFDLLAGEQTLDAMFEALTGTPTRTFVSLGVGCGLARLGRGREDMSASAEVEIVADGFGFHVGYFEPERLLDPTRVRTHEAWASVGSAFDRGVGRSIWFVREGHPAEIAEVVSGFELPRQADVWGGVGVAAAFTGGVVASKLDELRTRCSNPDALATGARLGIAARDAVYGATEQTRIADRHLCGGAG